MDKLMKCCGMGRKPEKKITINERTPIISSEEKPSETPNVKQSTGSNHKGNPPLSNSPSETPGKISDRDDITSPINPKEIKFKTPRNTK